MSTFIRFSALKLVQLSSLLLLVITLAAGLLAHPVAARDDESTPLAPAACEPDGTQPSGAKYRICMPTFVQWNNDLFIYAHGYVAPNQPLAIPSEANQIADALNFQGYAFATTSYSSNGLAVRQGLVDVVDLVNVFKSSHAAPNRVFLLGFSEGGLITTLAVEQYPNVFRGALAGCGPIGDFREQVNHFGNFRVVFDYFFPGLMPGSAITVPQSLMDNWDSYYATVISPTIMNPSNAISVSQLISVTGAAYDPSASLTSTYSTIQGVLWYNVFATNDGITKLGGQPFDNQTRIYSGSFNDTRLNATIQRFSADPAAFSEIQTYYQTSGRLTNPLVTIHNSLDPIVPYAHEFRYREKVIAVGRTPRHDNISVTSYGHCNFTLNDLQGALGLLLSRVANPPPFQLFAPVLVR